MSDFPLVRVPPVRSGNAFEETMERLVRMVRLGQFPPGDRLPPQRELARLLGVSRTTLADALGQLCSAGWLTVRRGRYGGTYVSPTLPAGPRAPLPEGALADVLTLRDIVEPAAARLAAARSLSSADRGRLQQAHVVLADVPAQQYRPYDARFHLTVAELSGSPALVAVVADVRVRVNDLLDRIPLLEPNLRHSCRQHAEVVQAVLAGRPEQAEAAMRSHLEGSAALLRGFLS